MKWVDNNILFTVVNKHYELRIKYKERHRVHTHTKIGLNDIYNNACNWKGVSYS